MRIYGLLSNHTSIDQNDSKSRRPFSKRVHLILQRKQLGEVKEGQRRRSNLFALGFELQQTKSAIDLHNLEELDTFLSKVGQPEWKKLSWALKQSMLALIQPKLWEHPDEEVKLTISSCLSRVVALTSPLLPYNNDLMTNILQLIVEALQGLNNIMCPTYQKQCRIFKLMENFSFGTFMLNMECDELIF